MVVNAKMMGVVLLASMAALAVYYQQDGATGDEVAENMLNWDGKYFTSTVTTDEGSVTVFSDMAAKNQRIDTADGDSISTFLVLDGQAWDLTSTTMEANGQSFTFHTQCSKGEDDIAIWAEEQFEEENMEAIVGTISEDEAEGVKMDIDGTELELHVVDGKLTGMTYGDDGAAISSMTFDPIDPAVFELPEVCEGDQTANAEIIAAYIEASQVETRRRLREIEEEENWPEDQRTLSEADFLARRALSRGHGRKMWGVVGDAVKSGYKYVKDKVVQLVAEEASINMFNNRYAGPDQEGCAPADRWTTGAPAASRCGGPVSYTDACTVYHDHGCGAHAHSIDGISQPGTRGANAGAKEGKNRNVGCLYGPHDGFKLAEHCACTGTLVKCAARGASRGTCYNGQPDCRAKWTGVKVTAAFSIFPCWYQNKETYNCNCRWRGGFHSCGWRGCSGSWPYYACDRCTRTGSHCPLGAWGSAHQFDSDRSMCQKTLPFSSKLNSASGTNYGYKVNKNTCDNN